eukprot:SAG22_NODE_14988_length_360_cov_0.616858_1_plen_58_part_10
MIHRPLRQEADDRQEAEAFEQAFEAARRSGGSVDAAKFAKHEATRQRQEQRKANAEEQ